jgi:hypothetical protein
MAARVRAPHPANASRQSGATTKLAEEPIIQDHPVPARHGAARFAAYAPVNGAASFFAMAGQLGAQVVPPQS